MDASDPAHNFNPKRSVRVTIFNQTYNVSTSATDTETIERLAREVDELMATIARRAGNLDTARTAVLACLHIADRLHHAEQELDELRRSVAGKSRDLAARLDVALEP